MTSNDEISDEDLMRAYQLGDPAAFDRLYRRYCGQVYAYLCKRTKSKEQADEVFQATFLKVHRIRSRFNNNYKFSQWLFVIAKSSLIDHFRKLGRSLEIAEEVQVEDIPMSQPDTSPTLSSVEETEAILGKLPSEQKKVLEMRIFDELPYDEIARKLGRSEVSIRQIYSRSIRKLRTLFATSTSGGSS